MLRDIFKEVDKNIQFIYIVLSVGVIYIFSNIFVLSLSTIFGLLFGTYIIYENYLYIKEQQTKEKEEFQEKTEYLENIIRENTHINATEIGLRKTNYINDKQQFDVLDMFLHTSPELVNLIYSVRDFEFYNKQAYYHLVKYTNYMLRIKYYLYLKNEQNKPVIKNPRDNFTNMLEFANLTLNYFQSFIITLPNFYNKKFEKSMHIFRQLIKHEIISTRDYLLKEYNYDSVNIQNIYIDKYENIRYYESQDDSFSFFLKMNL